MTPFIWSVEPGLEGRGGCCLFSFPLEYGEARAAKERCRFAQQWCIFNSSVVACSLGLADAALRAAVASLHCPLAGQQRKSLRYTLSALYIAALQRGRSS